MKSAAQQWIDEGIEKGVLMGEQKGIAQGVEKVARNMLSKGADIEFVAETTGIAPSQLETWMAQ